MSDLHLPFADELLARSLIDALPVPAALHRGDALLAANTALQRLSGLDEDALRALPAAQLLVETDRAALQAAARASLAGQETPALASTLLTRDASERQVEITQRLVVLGGQPTVLLTCIDHSDIHHVQSSLFGLSDMLRQIVDHAPLATFVLDMNHRVTHWNAACASLTGKPAHEMIGRTDTWRAFYPTERPLMADLVVDGLSGPELMARYGEAAQPSKLVPGFCEVEAFFGDLGETGRWIFFTAAPLRNAQGEIIGAVGSMQDITTRKQAEEELMCHRNQLELLVEARSQELEASMQALEAFVDNAPIGVSYVRAHRIERCNRAMEQMFGMAEGSAVGRDTPSLFGSPAEFKSFLAVAGPELLAGRPTHQEQWLRRVDGERIWVQMNAFMPDPKDPEWGSWWMVQDRTEVRAAQDELREQFERVRDTNRKLEEAQNQLLQSEKMASIGQLAAGVAHEINNPIGFVSSNLNTLRQYVNDILRLVDTGKAAIDQLPNEPLLDPVRQMRDEIEIDYLREDLPQLLDESADGLSRVKKIVQDLKDFSRVDQSEWQEADLNAGLESTLNVVRNEVKYKADVVKSLGSLPAVRCLAGQLNQVFMNLIVNASHAISGHGTITLSSGTQDAWAWIQVDDTGCGMSDEVRRRIFEPFYTTKEVGKGTGLGLSLAFSIVQRHAGAIQVRSTPGVGSAFRVWVPIAGPESVPPGSQPPAWS
ncbi:PAS domain S-box protein [Ideonella sp. 4Y16]|uniref:histidine kinase n=1 Tax=Ideonella alba TaxID=2824118 RepID=A0A940YF95_9BURK|nr:PAS domain S-box protein [Ideonella alba]MBQ0931400.1 PAS domain S-box protein [Ideonella alba]MBQ0945012.1 PAS domain S-box protein [Ideonella alba]